MRKLSITALLVLAILMLSAAPTIETETLTDVRQINVDGFGSVANKYAFSMAVFDGSLYVGTLNMKNMGDMASFLTGAPARRGSFGAEVWRYDSDGTWTEVVKGGLGDSANIGVRKMVTAFDCLFAVTANHNRGMEVWRTCDGNTWEAVVTEGFGQASNTSGRGMGVFKGHLYVGLENRRRGAQLWRTADGLSWEMVADKGIESRSNWWLSDFAVFDDRMYMGTLNLTGMEVYRTRDGKHFERVLKGGIDKWTNFAGMKLTTFNDRLYLSTMDFFRGFDLYVSDDGLNFKRILKKGHTDRHNAYLWQMEIYNDRLYAGTYFHRGLNLPKGTFSLYSTAEGDDWTVENTDGFGNPWYYGIRSMAVFDDMLIVGTASARYGCKIYSAKIK